MKSSQVRSINMTQENTYNEEILDSCQNRNKIKLNTNTVDLHFPATSNNGQMNNMINTSGNDVLDMVQKDNIEDNLNILNNENSDIDLSINKLNKLKEQIAYKLNEVKGVIDKYSSQNIEQPKNEPIKFRFVRRVRRKNSLIDNNQKASNETSEIDYVKGVESRKVNAIQSDTFIHGSEKSVEIKPAANIELSTKKSIDNTSSEISKNVSPLNVWEWDSNSAISKKTEFENLEKNNVLHQIEQNGLFKSETIFDPSLSTRSEINIEQNQNEKLGISAKNYLSSKDRVKLSQHTTESNNEKHLVPIKRKNSTKSNAEFRFKMIPTNIGYRRFSVSVTEPSCLVNYFERDDKPHRRYSDSYLHKLIVDDTNVKIFKNTCEFKSSKSSQHKIPSIETKSELTTNKSEDKKGIFTKGDFRYTKKDDPNFKEEIKPKVAKPGKIIRRKTPKVKRDKSIENIENESQNEENLKEKINGICSIENEVLGINIKSDLDKDIASNKHEQATLIPKRPKKRVIIKKIKRQLSKEDPFNQETVLDDTSITEISEKDIFEKHEICESVDDTAEIEPFKPKTILKLREFHKGDLVRYGERFKKTGLRWRKATIVEKITSISYKLNINGEDKTVHVGFLKRDNNQKVNFGGKEYLEIDYEQLEEEEEAERNYSIWDRT